MKLLSVGALSITTKGAILFHYIRKRADISPIHVSKNLTAHTKTIQMDEQLYR